MKRTRLKPISDRRLAERDERAEMRDRVFTRDGGRCRLAGWLPDTGPCSGVLTVHHLRKSAQGGPYTLVNLLSLCAGHNTWVEDNPDLAHELGLVIRRGDDFADAWRQLLAVELVDYWWTGGLPPRL